LNTQSEAQSRVSLIKKPSAVNLFNSFDNVEVPHRDETMQTQTPFTEQYEKFAEEHNLHARFNSQPRMTDLDRMISMQKVLDA
jgi:hypothetical protein